MTSTELDQLASKVNEAIVQMSYRWQIFCQLYDSGQDNIDTLNRRGSNVFQLLQKLIIDDVILSLSRLTDPSASAGNKNASIRNLLQLSRQFLESIVYDELDDILSRVSQEVRILRVHRNKALVHADIQYVLGKKRLPPLTYDELEKVMESTRDMMSQLTSKLFNRTEEYDVLIAYGCDGLALLDVLKRGNDVRDLDCQ